MSLISDSGCLHKFHYQVEFLKIILFSYECYLQTKRICLDISKNEGIIKSIQNFRKILCLKVLNELTIANNIDIGVCVSHKHISKCSSAYNGYLDTPNMCVTYQSKLSIVFLPVMGISIHLDFV